MRIKSLHLKEIRSYENQKVEFSTGTTLLSGDIGSGKSTILLAMEFALFGLLRGKTSPSELLRHGAKEGSVSLALEVQGHEVVVTRGLKRGSSAITQTAGTLSVDGVEEQYVAMELKARVLSLLGYPESLISKSTNLFRYTVYTPQEEVKAILYESVEERKDIMRKIFDIDKYKRVTENAAPYISDLRERVARLKGQTDDLKTLREQLQAQERELLLIQEKKEPLEKQLEQAKLESAKAKEAYTVKVKENEVLQKEKTARDLKAQQIKNEQELLTVLQGQYKRIKERLEKVEKKEITYDAAEKVKREKLLEQLAKNKDLLAKKIGELQAKEKQAHKLSDGLDEMDVCPTCHQKVGDDHKAHMKEHQEKLLAAIDKKKGEYDVLELKMNTRIDTLKKEVASFVETEKQLYAQKQQEQQLLKDRKEQEKFEEQIKEKQQRVEELEREFKLKKEVKLHDVKKEQDVYDAQVKLERQLELECKEFVTKEQVAKQTIEALQTTLANKEKVVTAIKELTTVKTWMQELFVPLVKTIEKRVLLAVYQEFNEHFVSWFNLLIDDETISVRLDEDFTPLVEQNGFDTSIGNLSGGEKTSLALAYRLALNKVLNNYYSSLHTTGLLILDEPTDGFSTYQIDKLRDAFEKLGIEQVIVVSHELKLESIADHVIHITKDHQISNISYSTGAHL